MYRRLTNSILFCCLTHRCIVVYDISCNFHCPFLDITFHENSPHSLLFYNLCGPLWCKYIILQITVPHNLPEFSSATSEKLDVARYACVFLLCRMKIHSALLVQLIFVCCTRPCQQSCRDGLRMSALRQGVRQKGECIFAEGLSNEFTGEAG